MPHTMWPRSIAAGAPVSLAGHCWAMPPQNTLRHSKTGLVQSLCGLWVVVSIRFCWVLWVSLRGMRFDSEHSFHLSTILLGLLFCPYMWSIYFWWNPTFFSWWLFSRELQFWSSHRRRWAHVLLFCQLFKIPSLIIPTSLLCLIVMSSNCDLCLYICIKTKNI